MRKKFLAAALIFALAAALCPKIATPAMAAESDFVIDENGYLTKYVGPGGDVFIPEGINGIRRRAFQDMPSLTSITLPDSKNFFQVNVEAFYNCSNLANVTVPFQATPHTFFESYGNSNCFVKCPNATIYSYGENSSAAQSGAPYVNLWENFDVRSDSMLYRYTGSSSDVVIPAGVKAINDSVFQNNTSITSVTLPESLTTIRNNAFDGCTNLTSITMSDGLVSIGSWAFEDCTSLTNLVIPGGVAINFGAFKHCTGLTSVTFLPGDTSIGQQAFIRCANLSDVTIPPEITKIYGDAFYDTPFIKALGDYAVINGVFLKYQGSSEVTDLVIPQGVTAIAANAGGWYNTTSVIIPDGVTSIGAEAFTDESHLSDVTIPDSVTCVGDDAFVDSPWLKSMGDFGIIKGHLVDYQGPGGNVVIPDSVTHVLGDSFFSNKNVTSVVIPDGMTDIGYHAFFQCANLTEITIPATVTDIGHSALADTGLTDIYYGGSEAQWTALIEESEKRSHFPNVPSTTVIHYSNAAHGVFGDAQELKWDYTNDHVLTITSGAIPADHQVIVAGLDEAGRFVEAKLLTAEKTSAQFSGRVNRLRMVWVDQRLAPQCESKEFQV